ncbi:MAG: DUF4012 domain-containing protein [Patescibacteria group bacterium]
MKNSPAIIAALIWKIFKYLIFLGAALLIFLLILLSGAYRNLRAAADSGLAGKAALTAAVQAAQALDWPTATERSAQAETNFSGALASLEQTHDNIAVKHLKLVRNQVADLEYLLKTAEILSRALSRVLPLAASLDQISATAGSRNFVDLREDERIRFLRLIYESEPELNGLRANLELASLNLGRIHRLGVLWPIYSQISDIKAELDQVTGLMNRLSPLVKLLPALSGYPEDSRFLLIFQNNDELRASGGFIGVYGLLTSRKGQIVSLDSNDSYHLDMPASLSADWRLEPPAPIKKYLKVEKWYLRDANWSPDWPTAAKQINEIFQGESRAIKQTAEPFTGIVAITPDFVADLIRLVGPITVKGATYNADNFQPLLQYNVEIAYKDQAISAWDRKEIINELIAELRNRLFKLSASGWAGFFKVLDQNITDKNIQLYFSNQNWERLAQSLGAGGEVAKTAGDYLLVVDSNLGAFKSDAVVKKSLSYAVTENNDNLTATVRLNYRHEGGFDWRTTRYRSYTRIYTPLGSRFLSFAGIEQSKADFSVSDDTALEKTVFSFFFTIEPGDSREITLNYTLPVNLKESLETGRYGLLVQKQAGQRMEGLNISIKPAKGKARSWHTDFINDKNFQF